MSSIFFQLPAAMDTNTSVSTVAKYYSGSDNYSLYSPVASAAAATYGVPDSLFQWQIGQESSWDPNAYNPSSGTIGIAQFKPTTAAGLGVDPTDPTQALYGAAAYDAQLYQQTGDWGQVLQRYGTTAGAPASVQTAAQRVLAGLGSWWDPTGVTDISKGLSSAGSNVQGAVSSGINAAIQSSFGGWSFGRIASILLGLILVAGGLYLFRPVSEFVNTTAGEGLGAAAKAAIF